MGLLTGCVALGVGQLVAGITGGMSAPLIAVGNTVIDASPQPVKTFAIDTFGSSDKMALLIGIGVILAIFAVVLGIVAVRRPRMALAGLAVFGLIGVLAAITRPTATAADVLPSIAGTIAGGFALLYLRRSMGFAPVPLMGIPISQTGAGDGLAGSNGAEASARAAAFDRRRFLMSGAFVAGAAAVSTFAGRWLLRRSQATASRAAVRIPAPSSPARPLPAGADLHVPGLTPFVTSNDRFYRVDTTLFVPSVAAQSWALHISGMVDRPITLTYAELLQRPLIERDVTLTCVSNQVGGRYAGNARWIGAPLKALLEEAGVHPGANQIVSRSVDGFTVGTPTAVAMDGRDSMLAVAMNGQPLPLEHGFPVRMIVPGLYGYVSATKWIQEIELSTFQAFDAYWIRRGWAQQAPIKTESRIDTPNGSSKLRAGTIPVAGVAWAQDRGIRRVELQVDDGPWLTAELSAQDTIDTWRQWVVHWDATAGTHTLTARATDDTGETQTAKREPPAPNGASGYPSVTVTVQ
jgi:DMSO/TMAO reductase YedYZ molybdopterin-dependent catalytic subunit